MNKTPLLLAALLVLAAVAAAPVASAEPAACDARAPDACVPTVWVTSRGEACVHVPGEPVYCTPILSLTTSGPSVCIPKGGGFCVGVNTPPGRICIGVSDQVPLCIETD